MKTQKVFKTENNEILIVTAHNEGCASNKYISVTGILITEAIDTVRQDLEDGELWRMAVAAEQTELSLNDWIEQVFIGDHLGGFDNSLFKNTICIDGEDYIFNSLACGCMHDEIKQVTSKFDLLIDLHLKSDKMSIDKANILISKIKSDNVDSVVELITKELINI